MFLQRNLAHKALAARPLLGAAQTSQRDYFSVFEKLRDRFAAPVRHIQSFTEPDGYNYQSQMPEGYRMHGNTAASFSASLTQNAIELHQWHEMESTVHSQFGTVDNPVLIFTSDSSWRIVICMGPGIEDDSHSHEKIFYMVREGPMNRCQVCGQCFKIVRLKDEFSEQQDYYSMMFSTLSHFDVSEEDLAINLTSFFGDRPQATMQTVPATNVYIHLNNDEADRILVDPAYKLEKLREAHEKLYAMHEAYRAVDRQMASQRVLLPTPYGRDNYETWIAIEESIRKFDRLFNKVEKFEARKFSDPDNHERRERRMMDRRRERQIENFTYFFGGLTEEEQQYRDYFETDLEMDPEDAFIEETLDQAEMAAGGDLNPKLYDFVETALATEVHENFEGLVADKIFKYKYRQYSDAPEVFARRQKRVGDRQVERARMRDPAVEKDLHELYTKDAKEHSLAQLFLDEAEMTPVALKETQAIREYMVREGVQQFQDYFESDSEEQASAEFINNLSNRDRIRFMEVFDDYTIQKHDHKDYAMIKKREFNPELSAFSNVLLDLADFRDRVRPLANDISLLDATRKHQRYSVDEIEAERRAFMEEMGLSQTTREEISDQSDAGSAHEAAERAYEQVSDQSEIEDKSHAGSDDEKRD